MILSAEKTSVLRHTELFWMPRGPERSGPSVFPISEYIHLFYIHIMLTYSCASGVKHLEEIMSARLEPPAVNQIEVCVLFNTFYYFPLILCRSIRYASRNP